MYFVTICTKGRVRWFGEVHDESMVRSPIGEIVDEELMRVGYLREGARIDSWIVMPDHVHAIVCIVSSDDMDPVETARSAVSTDIAILIPISRLKARSLGSIIGSWKAGCSKRIWAAGVKDFRWQERFHDRIIRDEREFQNVQAYIVNNPEMWCLKRECKFIDK